MGLSVFVVLFLLDIFIPSHGRTVGRRPVVVGCVIGLNYDLPKKNEPLMLVRDQNNELSLAIPETEGRYGSISLREGQELVVACPGNKNYVQLTEEEDTRGTCLSDSVISVGGRDISTDQLECKNRVTASLSDTGKPCASGKGTIVNIGFKVEKWFTLIESCHNKAESSSYYSTHKVHGSNLAGKVIESSRPGFSRGNKEFYKGFNPDQIYSQTNQEAVFNKLFGSKLTAKYLDKSKSLFLARGHLAPDADFLFGTWQLLTYFYINAAPQWQSINAGHWLTVENQVRKLAISLGADLDVATGTHGVLRLADEKENMEEIYLAGKGRLPVPDIYWKILHNPQDNACIALVSTNNPFLEDAPKTICEDVCRKYGWPDLKSDFAKGFVYCCRYQDFKNLVKDVPQYNCQSILEFHA